MGARFLLDAAKPDVAEAVATIAPAIDPAFVEALADRLEPHRAALGTASAELADALLREVEQGVLSDRGHLAAGFVGVAVERAARRVEAR